MDLIEGVSNEVFFTFIVTILLILVAVFYAFFSEGTSVTVNTDGSINHGNIDRHRNNDEHQSETRTNVAGDQSETRDNIAGDQSETRDNVEGSRLETNGSDISTAREETLPHSTINSTNVTGQTTQSETTREDNVRRRMVNSPESREDESANEQDETMVVKVKHNENIQTFNVSKKTTVIELKRLAFNDELNAGRRVRFVFAGQLLKDNDLLTRHGVASNTVVHCVISDPPQQTTSAVNEHHEEDLDLSRFLIPLLTLALIMAWYGLISYKHIFSGSSIAILMFLTSLYVILVYVTTIQ
mgnify:CR=1 FL=1